MPSETVRRKVRSSDAGESFGALRPGITKPLPEEQGSIWPEPCPCLSSKAVNVRLSSDLAPRMKRDTVAGQRRPHTDFPRSGAGYSIVVHLGPKPEYFSHAGGGQATPATTVPSPSPSPRPWGGEYVVTTAEVASPQVQV
jgi:hypothetical protein